MVSFGKCFIMWSILLLLASCSTMYCSASEFNVHKSPLSLMKSRNVEEKITKIVGGYPAAEGEVPWQVALLRFGGTSLFCGGTLISSDVVLTAAHCLVSDGIVTPNDQLHVGYGGLSQSSLPIISAVKEVLVHEDYDEQTSDNDITLLILEEPVDNFTSLVFPANLPFDATEDYTGEEVTASGWGTLFSGASSLPEELQAVQVEIWSNTDCADAYASLGSITENMVCAGVEDFSKDACQGDSGGPLVKVSNESNVIVGVTSFGYGCAEQGFPGVYARVTKYLDWIRNTACAANSTVYEDDDCIIVTEDPCADGGCTTDDAAFIMDQKQLLILHLCAALLLLINK